MKLNQQIQASLQSDPAAPAIEFEGGWWPWQRVAMIAQGLDAVLAQAGLSAGTRVGLVARNRPPQIAAFAGALASERCVVMIYSAQSTDAIAADIRQLRLPVIVADRQDWTPATITAAREIGCLGLRLTHDAAQPIDLVPGLERLGPDIDRHTDQTVAMELLSSGTTGAPKRVPLLRTTFEQAVADAAAVYASGRGGRPKDAALRRPSPEGIEQSGKATFAQDAAPSPHVVFHPLGNVAGVTFLIPFLVQAHPVALLEKFSLPGWLAAVARHRPARTSLPPTALRMILDEAVPKEALASLASIGVGAAPLDPQLQQQFETHYGIPLLAGYGATEFCGVVANWTLDLYRQYSEVKRGSVGRARPGVSLRVVDAASGALLPAGEVGVLEAQVLRVGPDWIRTTDLALLDADAFLYLRGRADHAINRGGFKVLPDEVAQVLRQHPDIADAAVIGLPDVRLGQVPVAAVELRPGAPQTIEEALLAYARGALVAYQVPVRILIVDALPRNPSMKVSLPELRALFEEAGHG